MQDFFYQNARMYLEEYRADGLRFDVTTQINGEHLKLVVDRLRRGLPRQVPHRRAPAGPPVDRHATAGSAPRGTPTRTTSASGRSPARTRCNKVKGFLGWDGYDHAWNLVKYTLGSHDDVGDHERTATPRTG